MPETIIEQIDELIFEGKSRVKKGDFKSANICFTKH